MSPSRIPALLAVFTLAAAALPAPAQAVQILGGEVFAGGLVEVIVRDTAGAEDSDDFVDGDGDFFAGPGTPSAFAGGGADAETDLSRVGSNVLSTVDLSASGQAITGEGRFGQGSFFDDEPLLSPSAPTGQFPAVNSGAFAFGNQFLFLNFEVTSPTQFFFTSNISLNVVHSGAGAPALDSFLFGFAEIGLFALNQPFNVFQNAFLNQIGPAQSTTPFAANGVLAPGLYAVVADLFAFGNHAAFANLNASAQITSAIDWRFDLRFVPEPGTALLLGAGLLAALGIARRAR